MSVDTYLKGKNLAGYRRVEHDDVEVLVAPSMARWSQTIHVDARSLLLFKRFKVLVEHAHGPT